MSGAKVSATCVHPGGIKTNIARAARVSESLKDLGFGEVGASGADFERRLFRTTAERAAEIIPPTTFRSNSAAAAPLGPCPGKVMIPNTLETMSLSLSGATSS